jgi:hypothetical protein
LILVSTGDDIKKFIHVYSPMFCLTPAPTARPKETVLGLLWRESGVEQCQVTPMRQAL